MVGSFQLTLPKRVGYFPLWHGTTSADGTVAIRHKDEGRPKAFPAGNRGSSVSKRPRRCLWEQRRGRLAPAGRPCSAASGARRRGVLNVRRERIDSMKYGK